MVIPGTSSEQPVKEFLTVRNGFVSPIKTGDILMFAEEGSTVYGGEFGVDPTVPDGVTVRKATTSRVPHGIAMEDAEIGETFRMQTYGYCTYIVTDGTCDSGARLYCAALGTAGGHYALPIGGGWRDPNGVQEAWFGQSLEDDSGGYITAAWINFK